MARHTAADYNSLSVSQEIKILKKPKAKSDQNPQPQYLERVVSLLFHCCKVLQKGKVILIPNQAFKVSMLKS